MKRAFAAVLFLAGAVLLPPVLSTPAAAEEVKMVGTIDSIKLAGDGKSATVVLKDKKTGNSVTLKIDDDLTLDKFKDHRIVEGDEIRTKFDREGDANHSKTFLKTAGC